MDRWQDRLGSGRSWVRSSPRYHEARWLPRGVEEILDASVGHKRWLQSESQEAWQGVQEQERPGQG